MSRSESMIVKAILGPGHVIESGRPTPRRWENFPINGAVPSAPSDPAPVPSVDNAPIPPLIEE